MTEENVSSEVEEKGLTKEALEATAEAEETPSAEEPEQTVPLHKHTVLRTRAQEAEVGKARVEGELAALKAQIEHNAPAAKSPLDLEIERQTAEGIPESEMTITPALYRKQQEYDRQVTNQAATATATQTLGAAQLKSAQVAKGAHEDFSDVLGRGTGLLTEGQLLDISKAGDGFGELAYSKCEAALALANPKPEPKPKTDPAPETKQSESEAVKTQAEILKGLNVDPTIEAAAQL